MPTRPAGRERSRPPHGLGDRDGRLGDVRGDQVVRRREGLGGDQVAVGARRQRRTLLGRRSTVSAIRSETSRPASRRACWTARTRSRARPSAASSGVTSVSRTTKPPLRQHAGRRTAVGGAGDGLEGVLPLLQRQPAGRDGAVLGDRPVARLRALDRDLDVLAQARPGGAGVDGELLLDAVRRRLVGLGREQPHRLDVDLVAHDRLEAGQRGRVVDDDGQRRRAAAGCAGCRPCAARTSPSRPRAPGPSRRPARRRPAARRPAASRPGAPSGHRSARARPPRSSAASAARRPGRRPRAPCRACRRPSALSPQKRSRERRMYQFVSTSRNDRVASHASATAYASSDVVISST